MKYVHLPNFRFLTGHGKDFALAVDEALADGDRASNGEISRLMAHLAAKKKDFDSPLRPGTLNVFFSSDTRSFEFDYIPNDDDRCLAVAKEHGLDPDTSKHIELSCVLRLSGSRRVLTTLPLHFVLSSAEDYTNHYQIYHHFFITDENAAFIPEPNEYVGVTKRSWQVRWKEHLRSAAKGSHYRFHQAIRDYGSALGIQHSLMGLVKTEAEAMAAEENLVAKHSLHPKGLNMVPGGYAGIAFLHRMGVVGKNERVTPDMKHDFINRFFEQSSRKGISNLAAMKNWQDAMYAEKVICGAPDRLKPDQIRLARSLDISGLDLGQIASEVGAKNVQQIKRLLDGDTYSRIH